MAIQMKELQEVQGPAMDAGLFIEEKIALGGALYEVQELELKGTRNRILEAYEQVVQDPYVTAKYESLYASYPGEIASLRNIKMIFYVIHRRMLREIENQKKHRAMGRIIELDKSSYDQRFTAISGFIRRLLSQRDPVTRAAIAKYVSMLKADVLQASGGSSFAMKVLPEEFILMLVEWFGAQDWDGEEVVVHQKGSIADGEFCEFEDGYEINGRCSVIGNERLDGAFEMRESNGRFYATDKLTNLIFVPDATDDIVLSLHSCEFDNLFQLQEALMAGKEAYLTANIVDHDRLVVDGIRYRYSAPTGYSMHGDLDYVKVELLEMLVDKSGDPDNERLNVILFLRDAGKIEHEEPVVEKFILKSAAKAQAIVKGDDPFAL